MATTLTQLDPLPSSLPFEIISKTIGRGAYAAVKKGRSNDGVFAVKFIHKKHAVERGGISPRQLRFEVELHRLSTGHENLISFYAWGEDDVWIWLAMEFAAGGDLFDKIESDAGVPEDIAHFYFAQLISGLSWMHGKGIAHRDIKPENLLLDGNGNLKIADFGLAVLFHFRGKYRESTSVCGSPPYVAPEVCNASKCFAFPTTPTDDRSDFADIWSCGVVLFALLLGNTPWDEPTDRSFEFNAYVASNGRPTSQPWPSVPNESLSLIRGMLAIDPASRFTLERIRAHPWFTRPNRYLARNGLCTDGVNLATKMMENLRVDFSWQPALDDQFGRMSSTQPAAPTTDLQFEWERSHHVFASQPIKAPHETGSQSLWDSLAEDPTMSQFSSQPHLSTQRARLFQDICPPQRLTRFFSAYSFRQILPILSSALHRMGIATPPFKPSDYEDINHETWIPIKTEDRRKCPLRGDIIVERIGSDMLQVTFSKNVGDPLQWRRFFKEVTVLSKEAVYTGNHL
ncbi:kinase-like domain-containing protein [Sphaerosporella brunnea]|uniref:Kinase-like domain-containing protein n=1 Tax=Sphaerosporella brunnea TaxID=1250544 RepID=A0A5J5EGU7_9PEZI|nr:kinase-like domain-containing protein [Sphaerosporella brunnea]